uniref:AlNc14C217G9035 protein n=1 Tax=Albugo laibachii Nc14 TaxID=890382 RepID=F0WRN7_9STRA|nr:AlNc14C217G9035 [Albugo laibachii Nc14]|eukprot:CCA24001.1 AlNc14C217G9035 [Albugo laibachii Nc14]
MTLDQAQVVSEVAIATFQRFWRASRDAKNKDNQCIKSTELQSLLLDQPKLRQLDELDEKYREQMRILQHQSFILTAKRNEIQEQQNREKETQNVIRQAAKKRQKEYLEYQKKTLSQKAAERKEYEEQLRLRILKQLSPPKPKFDRRTSLVASSSLEKKPPAEKKPPTVLTPRRTSQEDADFITARIMQKKNQLEHRQRVVALYAQDLTPLVDGKKPKRLAALRTEQVKPPFDSSRRMKKTSKTTKASNSKASLTQSPEDNSNEDQNSIPLVPEIRSLAWMERITREVGISLD